MKVPPLRNDWAAYQFDQAVLYLGLVIESALHERVEFGPSKARESLPRYTLAELLDPEFRLPQPGQRLGLKALAAASPDTVGRFKQESKVSQV